MVFARVALKGDWHSFWVASLASLSARSFPFMPQWLGHQETLIDRPELVLVRAVKCYGT